MHEHEIKNMFIPTPNNWPPNKTPLKKLAQILVGSAYIYQK